MSEEDLPKGAVLVKDVLESMGIKHYEPAVVTQLLEFLYRYISDVLEDAQAYSSPPRNIIKLEDVMLAIQSQETFQFPKPPPQDVLMQLAERRNAQPLPELKKGFGLRLPPEEDCLLGANYQLARGPASSAPAEPMEVDGREGQGQSSLRPSAGASQRPHLDIQLLSRNTQPMLEIP
ncbi:g4167 [Coccomyxa elongata]